MGETLWQEASKAQADAASQLYQEKAAVVFKGVSAGAPEAASADLASVEADIAARVTERSDWISKHKAASAVRASTSLSSF